MSSTALYTCLITIHRATNVPVSDFNNFTSDPYFHISLSVNIGNGAPQILAHRTRTERSTRDPTFDSKWVVSGIPSRGFNLALTLMDEDPGNHDDKLGQAVLWFPFAGQTFEEGWESGEQEYDVHKRKGEFKSRVGSFVAKAVTREKVGHRCRVWVSVKVVGKAKSQTDHRIYTLGPRAAKAPNEDHSQPSLKASTFVANRLQLAGPVPTDLRHRYVGFAPFIKAMFKRKGIEGMILHRALHRQHTFIYNWAKSTVYGITSASEDEDHRQEGEGDSGEGKGNSLSTESEAFARQLLKMTSHGTHGRIFTYVIMLDGEWRFTETGEEFSIQFLSKHTMHSDVSIEIAFSGEFFVRSLHGDDTSDEEHTSPSHPSEYELVIDNDSGTYRPRSDLLPTLQAYLASPENLAAFGRVIAMDGFDEKLKKWKENRTNVKSEFRNSKGKGRENGKVV
ncbi:hypothetical protein EUX98_g2778 [Antrodiella citrinella]|uniref:C2 domain-containing protein n=1 Tax=Antrodiella citrinella TaxID=2447956 RepID=A0A4S4MY33_9APHY|nr:hypothetical protein EUX98_g2778 [Antrodiella citrinella]